MIKILFFSLASAFIFANYIATFARSIILRYYYNKDKKLNEFTRTNKMRQIIWKPIKPVDCIKCLTGWFALASGLLLGYRWESLLLFIGGIFIGAIFEAIKMRYL